MNIHILTEERHRVIRELLAAHGQVLASDLVTRFGVSDDTARRDLRDLAKAGACRRVYGGAVAQAPDRGPVAVRARIAPEAKARLANAAAALLEPGQLVFIDAGSTNIAIARAISRDLRITVATNAIGVAAALAEHPSVRLIVLGGVFDPAVGACLGAETERAIDRLGADMVLLGACALDVAAGVTAFDPADADAKRAMVRNSRGILVAATADKLATAAPFRVAGADAITHLVTEADAAAGLLESFAAIGCKVHRG